MNLEDVRVGGIGVSTFIALVLTVVIFSSVQVHFKILSDETNLLSVSKSMLFEKTVYNTTMGKFYYGNFNAIDRELPTRPLVFPYLVYLIHVLRGYEPANAFVLNFISLFALLFLVHSVSAKYSDPPTALGVTLLVASYPLISIYGTSGGFDLLSTVFFFLSLLSLSYFMSKRSSQSFSLLWMTCLIFANIRYESSAMVALIMLGLVCFRYLDWRIIRESSLFLAATPLLFLPSAWQKFLSRGKYENPPGVPLLSGRKFVEHSRDLVQSQLDFSFSLPYANVVTLLAIPCALFFLFVVLRRKQVATEKWFEDFAVLASVCVVANTVLFLSHHAGTPLHPAQARFFMIPSVAAAMFIMAAKAVRPSIISSRMFLVFSGFMFFLYHPIAVEGRFINSLILTREVQSSLEFLGKYADRNALIIADRPGIFTAQNYGAVDFNYAENNRGELRLDFSRHLFSEIIAFQRISYASKSVEHGYELDRSYRLAPLKEIQLSEVEFLRISRVEKVESP